MSLWHCVLSAADCTNKPDYVVVLYKKQFIPSSPKITCPNAHVIMCGQQLLRFLLKNVDSSEDKIINKILVQETEERRGERVILPDFTYINKNLIIKLIIK